MVHPVPNSGFARSYIVAGRQGFFVVDAGSVGAVKDVSAAIARLGKTMADVRFIVATHFHIDHIGGFGTLLRKCPPDTKILFHWLVADYLMGKRKLSSTKNWLSGFIPASIGSFRYVRKFSHLKFETLSGIPLPALGNPNRLPYPPDRIEYFGGKGVKRYQLGFDNWEVIETPGHTEDSVSFYNEVSKELICGDLILNLKKNRSGELNRFYSNRENILSSFQDLSHMIQPRIIYPGHGEPIKDADNALSLIKAFSR